MSEIDKFDDTRKVLAEIRKAGLKPRLVRNRNREKVWRIKEFGLKGDFGKAIFYLTYFPYVYSIEADVYDDQENFDFNVGTCTGYWKELLRELMMWIISLNDKGWGIDRKPFVKIRKR